MGMDMYANGTLTIPTNRQQAAAAALAAIHGGEPTSNPEQAPLDHICELLGDLGFSTDGLDHDSNTELWFSSYRRWTPDAETALQALVPYACGEIAYDLDGEPAGKWVLTDGVFHDFAAQVTYPGIENITLGVLPAPAEGNGS